MREIEEVTLFVLATDPSLTPALGEPQTALECLAPFLGGVHCKDGLRTKQPGTLGTEVVIGQGQVDFPWFLRRLVQLGYAGPLVIEREHGPNVLADVLRERAYLEGLLATLEAS